MLVGKKVLQEEGTKLPKRYRDLKYKSNGSDTILGFTLYHRVIVMKATAYSKTANGTIKIRQPIIDVCSLNYLIFEKHLRKHRLFYKYKNKARYLYIKV